MGPVKKTAKALGESLFDEELGKPIGQLIVICGRNKDLVSTLESLEWKIPVKVITSALFSNQPLVCTLKSEFKFILLTNSFFGASNSKVFSLLALQIRGFETQMEKWMGACDCIITKVCFNKTSLISPCMPTVGFVWIIDFTRDLPGQILSLLA